MHQSPSKKKGRVSHLLYGRSQSLLIGRWAVADLAKRLQQEENLSWRAQTQSGRGEALLIARGPISPWTHAGAAKIATAQGDFLAPRELPHFKSHVQDGLARRSLSTHQEAELQVRVGGATATKDSWQPIVFSPVGDGIRGVLVPEWTYNPVRLRMGGHSDTIRNKAAIQRRGEVPRPRARSCGVRSHQHFVQGAHFPI